MCLSMQMYSSASTDFKTEYKDGLSKTAKYIYESLADSTEKMKSGNKEVVVVFPDNTSAENVEGEVQNAISAFKLDTPQIFWVSFDDFYFSFSTSENENGKNTVVKGVFEKKDKSKSYFTNEYTNKEEVKEDIEAVEKKISSILQEGEKYTSPYYKLKFFYNYLLENNKYNSYVKSGNEDQAPQSAWCASSAFLSENNEEQGPVCEGFAKAFKILCDRSGVPCVLIAGDSVVTSNGKEETSAHMWCAVMLDEKWYAVDPTWDNFENENGDHIESYEYFLIGADTEAPYGDVVSKFSQTHKENTEKYYNVPFSTPQITANAYEYEERESCEVSFSVQPISCRYGESFTFDVNVDSQPSDSLMQLYIYKNRVCENDLIGKFDIKNGKNTLNIAPRAVQVNTERLVLYYESQGHTSPLISTVNISVSPMVISVNGDGISPIPYSDGTYGASEKIKAVGVLENDEVFLAYDINSKVENDGKKVVLLFENIVSSNRNYKLDAASFTVEYEANEDGGSDNNTALFIVAGACGVFALAFALYAIISRARK